MELKQLRIFACVAEKGSFSKAAVALSTAQPVVTRHIRALEEALDTQLFYRNGRGAVLTDAGKLLQANAEEILSKVSLTEHELNTYRRRPSAKLSIGVPPSVGTVLTTPLVMHLRKDFPHVSLRVVEAFSGHVLEWLVNGRVDVAVLYGNPKHPSLLAEPLLEDQLFLLGPASNPDALQDGSVPTAMLADLPMILPSRPHGLRSLIESAMMPLNLVPRVELELEAMPSAISLVEHGLGYTVLPYASISNLAQAGRIRCWPLTEPALTRTLAIATSTQSPMTELTRSMVQLVRAEVRHVVAAVQWRPSFTEKS